MSYLTDFNGNLLPFCNFGMWKNEMCVQIIIFRMCTILGLKVVHSNHSMELFDEKRGMNKMSYVIAKMETRVNL